MDFRAIKHFFMSATARLAASYLLIIMLMSIGFSIVFYNTSWHELARQVPPPESFGVRRYEDFNGPGPSIDKFFRERIDEGRHELLIKLVILNLLALVGGSLLSYYLARQTLEPIEGNMEAQSQFVSDASHELRTPLTALQTTNEVALRKKKISDTEIRDLLNYNVAEAVKLQQLTDSLLKLAHADNGVHEFAPVKVPELVSDALNIVVNQAVARNITIEDNVARFSVPGDKAALTQALVTLLDNAIKYSPDKSKINVDAAAHGKHALINVRDHGSGISPENLPHIFDRFYRADESRNKQQHDGFGIGLALAKKIIEQHHGEIIAASTPGKGSTFTLKLPLS